MNSEFHWKQRWEAGIKADMEWQVLQIFVSGLAAVLWTNSYEE